MVAPDEDWRVSSLLKLGGASAKPYQIISSFDLVGATVLPPFEGCGCQFALHWLDRIAGHICARHADA
ncbi:hypothetical protein CN072_15225 [Sinorhizobium meliloti]|nr:hypothetical protein CN072_15225 [Sinorhizobium meliloti]